MELIFVLILYFVPAIVAASRRHKNFLPIVLVNTCLGWSIIGWLWALIWATTANTYNENYGQS